MSALDVLQVLEALETEVVSANLVGGWGVDALIGRQTRRHTDLDVFIPDVPTQVNAAKVALARVGYRFVAQRPASLRMPGRLTFVDGHGRSVDLLPVTPTNEISQTGELPSPFTVGRIANRNVRCVTAEVQLKLHEGVPASFTSDADLEVLRRHLGQTRDIKPDVDQVDVAASPLLAASTIDASGSMQSPRVLAPTLTRPALKAVTRGVMTRLRAAPPPSALVIPVPEAERLVSGPRSRYDPAERLGMPAHVTVLYPFIGARRSDPKVEARLREAFAGRTSFRFQLTRVASFPGVLYVAPEPAAPFIGATRAVHAAWPQRHPYDGAHPDIVPHLSVAHGTWPEELETELATHLPLEATAREIWWMMQDSSGRWTPIFRIPLVENSPAAKREETAGARRVTAAT